MANPPYLENNSYSSDEEAQSDWDRAIAFIEQKKDAKAIPILSRLWENGYVGAAHEIAKAKERMAVLSPEDLLDAEMWYQHAVEATEDLGAKLNLARIIIRRREIDAKAVSAERLSMAIGILENISEKGHPGVAVFLASEYLSGKNVQVDVVKSESLFLFAAIHKYVIAFSMLRYINFRKGRYIFAIKYWLMSVFYLVIFLLSNPKDERLLGVFSRGKTSF